MSSETDERTLGRRVAAGVCGLFEVQTLVLVFVGVLAGYSVSVLTADAVAAPVVGSLPGPLVGGAGLVVAAGVYRRVDCCGSGDCGCSGECGDSCSYDS